MKNVRVLKKLMGISLMAANLALLVPITAFAGSAITSVTIRVDSDIEPGDGLPSITIEDRADGGSSSDDGLVVSTSNSKYYIRDAEWVSSDRDLDVGEQPKLRVYISPRDEDDHYFKGTYSSSNITIKYGDYVSSKKKDGDLIVTLKIDPVEGNYDEPDNAYWRDSGYGKARWEAGEISSDYYDIFLYRGSSIVTKIEDYKGTSYDFYPYMTKAGTYTFKVRTVPHTDSERKYAKKSDWTESDDMYINAEHVSDGSGQTGSSSSSGSQVGWIKSNGIWYYRYPDGSYQKDSWLSVDGKWYLFDINGRMLTGWQNKNGQSYFLNPSGDMLTGWKLDGGKWYYLNENQGSVEGSMCRNSWITKDGKTYYVDSNGVMVENWQQVAGNYYYFYPGSGHRAENTYIDGFYVDANGIWKK